jgi:O-antigen ligase
MLKRSFLIGLLLFSGVVDMPSYIHVGTISVNGLLTILVAAWVALFIFSRPKLAWRGFKRIWPLSALLLYSIAQCFWTRASSQEVQNVCLLWIFVGLIVLTLVDGEGSLSNAAIERALLRATAFASVCYALIVLFVGFGREGIGANSFIAARSFALYALLGVGLLLGRWAGGSRISLWLAAALILLVALSLSRTALVAGILLFPLARLRSISFRDVRRFAVVSGLAACVLFYLVVNVPALRSRVLGDKSIEDYIAGDASVDTSGRLLAWTLTLDSYNDSPWFGKGPGTANNLVAESLSEIELDHPLNEYLRFLHDSGALGLALLLMGCVQLLVLCRRAYRKSIARRSALANFHLGTFLALVAVLLTMMTDNTASYLYVMAPLGILLGTTLRSLEGYETVASRARQPSAVQPIPPTDFSMGAKA